MNKKYIVIAIILVLIVASFVIIKTFSYSPTGNAIKEDTSAPVKEFTIESFYDEKGVWFSLKEISVNKGDIVRIKVTNIKGNHDLDRNEYLYLTADCPYYSLVTIRRFEGDRWFCSISEAQKAGFKMSTACGLGTNRK